MNTKLMRVCFLLAVCLGFLMTSPTQAASLQLVPNWGASGVPTNVSMYAYVPDNLPPNPPILVLLHYWGGGAGGVFAEAQAGGIVAAADQYGFIMVVPERSADCWDSGSTQSLTHDGGGETQAIAQMVKYAITNYQANSNRVYVAGTSCGAMMTEAMLAVYPDIFKAGVAFAGQAVGGAWTPVTHTAQEWGNIVRNCYPGYTGPRPRVQLWHGTADGIINYTNQLEAIMQWGNVLGLSINPTVSNTVVIPGITNQWIHQVWKDTNGASRLDAWSEIDGGHGTDANLNARYVIPFLGLDKAGPVDPGAGGQRGRPHINAAHSTFVGDNGQPLRGPYTSTEWTGAWSADNIPNMKSLGFNAVHLYAESFDPSYPTNGSTAPGYHVDEVDKIVAATRDAGLYLVMTIGNGALNGNHNTAWTTNFWNLYAARYANETHVLFEIHNEPMAWGPSYLTGTSPAGTLDMEIAAYRAIRAVAPNSPVLLFSYAVLGGSGGSDAALTDIHAFNQTIFGNTNAVWTNVVVGFHGYAGAGGTAIAVSNLISAGYPCMMTEFGAGTWGGGNGGLDVEGVANWERLGVSWLAFAYIPPSGVSDDVTRPDAYINRVVNSGLSWTPDYGSFPTIRSVYGNGGYPWTTPDYNNNTLSATLRIEAEKFDNGGKGVAYFNANSTNLGGQYRTGETVGIETTSDTGGGYDVGWNAAGDWLEYTMKVTVAGTYNLRLRVAGTGAGSVRVLAYGNNRNQTTNGVDLTGQWTLPNTGGNQTWQTVTNSVFLGPDQQRLRISVLAGGFNLNWIELSPASTGPIADGTYKFLNAANAAAMELSTSNTVVTDTPSGANNQQWTLRHIGGGLYQVTPAAGGNSWDSGGGLHLSPWGWGPGGNSCFSMLPTGGGYYRLFSTGSGSPLQPSTENPPAVNDGKIYTGAAVQQWAILAPSAPVFPIGLSVTAISATQNSLTWNAVTGATSYSLKRSAVSGGPYTTIASGVTATNYTDTVAAGTPYYYVVSTVVGGVESLNSAEATVALPFPWITQDVGSVGVAGSAAYTYSNGVFSVTGSGADIWGSSDAFRFAYVPITGDCTIVARVASEQNVDGWSKAGVMIRESLTDNAANAFMAVTPGNGVAWQARSSTGGGTGNNTAAGTAPYWVKLVRSGNAFTGYVSPDGTNWTQQGTATFTMASTAYVGLALTSHNNSSLCLATFDNVSLPGWPPPLGPTGLAATVASASQINLVWNAFNNATSYNVKRSATSGGSYTTIATGVMATNYLDTGVSVRAGYYYVVSAMVGGSETPNSAEASLSFGKLTGTIIGTAGSWNNSGNTITNVFDNNLNTYFDAPDPGNGDWVGLDFGVGVTNVITKINYCPRSGLETRMTNGVFQGANNPNFTGAVTLFTITNSPASGVFTSVTITNLTAFRYVRYLSPNGSWGNVAELEFYGYPSAALATAPAAPGGLAAAAVSSSQINLSWNVSAGATNYKVKRSTTNGGPYLVVASGSTATNCNDTGLAAATTYYYVVSALNAGAESTNSTQVSVTTAMPPPAAPASLTATVVSTNQINLMWTASSGATSYNVKRSATNGGPYTVASGVTATNYPDGGLAGGTMYYYVVSAVNAGGESANSQQAIATTASGTLGSLVHRYSFSETNGASIADSVGGPIWNGTLPSGGTFTNGQLTLASASSQYASLPTGIVGTLSNFTIVTWVKLNSTANWARIFDFGSDGTTNMFLTPQNGANGTLRFGITTNGGGSEQQINCSSTMSVGVWYQVAVTLNGNTGILYLNGLPVGTNTAMTLRPSSLGSTANNYLGRSQYPDPYFDGAIDEFRIYNVGLSAAAAAQFYAGGPSQTATVTLGNLNQTYNGTARSVTVTTTPTNLTVNLTYNGSANAPTNAGSYAVIGTISDANYQGSATNTLVISKGAGTVNLGNLSQTYDGTAKSASATTTPTNLTVNLTYNGSANAPTNAGSYTVIGTINDANYQGSATNTLVISKGAGTVTLSNLSQTYDGAAKSANATTTPTNLTVNITYNGSANAPTNAGSYTVIGTINDANYQGGATNTLVISKAISPQMSLALVGANLTVSWPQTNTGFTVQYCTNLMLGSWLNVTSSAPQIVGSNWQLALPPASNTPSAFYRLSK
jgi:poly(hydroxyalkanoate) depolymerase family esterase